MMTEGKVETPWGEGYDVNVLFGKKCNTYNEDIFIHSYLKTTSPLCWASGGFFLF